VPGRVIVKFRDSAKESLRTSPPTVPGFRAQDLQPLSGGARLWSLEPEQRRQGASVAEEEADLLTALEALRADPRVEYAHEDLDMEYFAVPGDPLYSQQWHYPAIHLPQAWNSVTGAVKVAVLDTGRLAHPDLNGRWTTGYDFGDNDADPTDDDTYHHGLHVAGIIAANANNGIGGAGICWGCQLMPVKVSNNNAPVLSNVGNALRWAADNGARVINMSFGTTSGTAPCSGYAYMQSAVDHAVQKNVVVVAAAGNDTANTANVTPASCNIPRCPRSPPRGTGTTRRAAATAWTSSTPPATRSRSRGSPIPRPANPSGTQAPSPLRRACGRVTCTSRPGMA
jgi:serine protease